MFQKTALITGATGELGQYIAKALAKKKFRVIVSYRTDETAAKKLAKAIKGTAIQVDVTDEKEVSKLFNKIGPVDVLINGVGNFIFKPLSKTSNNEFFDCLNNNLMSAWYCTKAVLPTMRKNKFGRIINFGSAGCDQLTARPMTTPYYIAKTGLFILTKSLAREEQRNGVTINMISPGIIPTSLVKPKDAPVVSFGDIAQAILFLLDDKNTKINGANIDVTGGWRPE